MQFVQPDTLIPQPSNPQSLNRYAYVFNNPILYNDPSGHKACTDDGYCGKLSDTSYQKHIYSNAIKNVYDWNPEGNWSLKELETIYQTGRDIERYVDGLTGGKGLAWMNEYLGGVSIFHGEAGRGSSSWPWKQIYLGKDWVNDYSSGDFWAPKQLFAHELGHTWDMSSGNYLGIGGGVGDDLMWAVFGDPRKSLRVFRYEKTGDPAIPLGDARWSSRVNGEYGNGSINDYAAEAFSWSIYNPNYLPFGPDGVVAMVVDQTIIQQAYKIP